VEGFFQVYKLYSVFIFVPLHVVFVSKRECKLIVGYVGVDFLSITTQVLGLLSLFCFFL